MDPVHWQQIKKIYQSAFELKPDQRKAFVEKACAGNESLRRQVESLLAGQPEAENFMEAPASN